MKVSKVLLSATAAVGLMGAASANAALSIFANVGGAPNVVGVTRENLDDDAFAAGIASILPTPTAAFVTGSSAGVFAAPFLSVSNGIGFGSPDQPNGVDTTRYLTTGSTGNTVGSQVEINFSSLQRYLGLLWGSVDLYNTIEFFNGAVSVGSLTGSAVTPTATGDQGSNGTFYVNINSDLAFNRVVMTSSQFAFEFDNLAFAKDEQVGEVPLPAAAWLLGSGLLGLFGIARRRRVES